MHDDDIDVIVLTASGAQCLVSAASVDAALEEWAEEDQAVTAWAASEEEAAELADYMGGAYDYR